MGPGSLLHGRYEPLMTYWQAVTALAVVSFLAGLSLSLLMGWLNHRWYMKFLREQLDRAKEQSEDFHKKYQELC